MLVMSSHNDIRARKQDYIFLNNMPYWRGFIFICLLCINVHVSNDTMQFKYKSFLGNIPTDMEPWDSWLPFHIEPGYMKRLSQFSDIYITSSTLILYIKVCAAHGLSNYVVYFVNLVITIVFTLHLRICCIDADRSDT